MKYITEITSDARQKLDLIGENGESITLKLNYKPTQQGWFFDIEYDGFVLKGMRIVNGLNLLRQWENIIPFGFMVKTIDGLDPFYQDDFTKQRAFFFLLNEEDVQTVEDGINEAE